MIRTKKALAIVCVLATVFTALFSLSPVSSAEPVLAFPGADGVGKYTVGGRGGDVYEVTTLQDGPGIPGSLRAAIEATGPRTIVFKVAGTIELKSELRVRNPYLTIAGQTAPGEGITLKGETFSITANEVIIRNIRVRLGDFVIDDAMEIGNSNNVIIDHCSVSWGVDETLSIKRSTNVTLQWTFVTEGLHDSISDRGEHSKGSLISGNDGQIVSLHHNLYAHHDARSPRPQGLKKPDEDPIGFFCDFTNNVVYDWGRKYAAKNLDVDEICTMNFINNYFLAGPSSDASNFMVDKNINTSMYFAGNYMNGKLPKDQYALIIYEDFKKPDTNWKLDAPFEAGMSKIYDAETAFAMVMKSGGAALNRDAVDERIVSEVLSGRGRIIDTPSEGGGWPELETGTAYTDTDRDGMPDDWETARGLNPNDPADGKLAGPEGYTNLELYLNSLMEGLFAQDVPVPAFDNTWRWLYHIFYEVYRFFKEVGHFFENAWAFVKNLF